MRFSESWLREWVDPEIDTAALVHQLTMAGLEVDSVEPVAPPLDGVVVGRIAEIVPHPDADRLRVCRVDIGDGTLLQVVCGAPNAREGLLAPLATVGAQLPDGPKIKRSKLRGVESHGMLCSAIELGLGEAAEGLLELPEGLEPGAPLAAALGLDDTAIEVDLTPNRGDCLGLAGIAREVGVLNRARVTPVAAEPVEAAVDDTFPVELAAPEGCPRYLGRVIRGIDPHATTPAWMQERLRRSGVRSLGPLVDVTNYVMLELGQPMHAFDLARLEGGIVVRWAEAGEKLLLLDGREVELDAETLVIADHGQAVAIAGVMGGELSGVADDTGTLFLESAFFAPTAIAGRARRYGMHTDASHRFERGVDPELQRRAMERATRLLLDIVGGTPGPIVEASDEAHLPRPATVRLRRERVRRLLGIDIPDDDVEEILARLGMEAVAAADGWEVRAPSYRFDVAIEADLIEELARIHGYEAIPPSRPHGAMTILPEPERRADAQRVAGTLVERGYHEAITFSFVDPARQALLDPGHEAIALANPISSDLAVMRTTLWVGLLDAVAHNLRRQQPRVRLFETGLRYLQGTDGIVQEPMVAGVACGTADPEQWGEAAREIDFFDVKGDVEALLGLTGPASDSIFVPEKRPALHPGQSARILRGDREIGWIGSLGPQVAQKMGLKGRILLFELSLSALGQGEAPSYATLSRFPAIRRDLAVVVDESLPSGDLCATVREAAGPWLLELQLFDIYVGKGVDSNRKSLALGLTLQHPSRTLKDNEVDTVIEGVVQRLRDDHGADLRE
ncbi:MAG: phenylalanine--tRNA ligase subunit beta [Gammaproteobacteria bacterium]|nr:phenylalanine--tRNA ligase subunit beta [Gammaproteobacteria bacterium]